ncbi:hypothetical protein MHC_01500 [Mycoplasma haemocanis str. Illinois]|uniref:Uncharacterized protein n=1 Tax=Mycoplasma haemocanis (strain Illinois) TaxID=1111676 RepID=H6N694_MYCHN|nr:hypothetical protein [Mycoplasma haemocanis]AEW45166.1 hypothetical protein MHC_01500 [Mycoplasma haemocanis str. Illinois]
MNIKLLLPPIVGGLGAALYVLQGSKDYKNQVKTTSYKEEPEKIKEPKQELQEDKYQPKIPFYKTTSDEVKKHREGKDGDGYYLVNPNNEGWWQKRAQALNQGDWKDFRDKCFSEVKSKKSDWDNVLGRSGGYYAEAAYVPAAGSFDFVALCVEKEELANQDTLQSQ